MNKKVSIIRSIWHEIWTLFLNGLLALLPIAITVGLLTFTMRLVSRWLDPLHNFIAPTFLGRIAYSEFFLVIIFIFLIGFILKVFILRSLLHGLESVVFRLPLIKTIYAGMKQLVHAFGSQDKLSFKKVVIIEFPRKGIYSLGFLTSTLPHPLAPEKNDIFYNIFIPTTPNPTSGFFVIVSEKEIKMIDLTRQEAMAMIISGGIIKPDRFTADEQNSL